MNKRSEIEVHIEIISRCILECIHCSSEARVKTKRHYLPLVNIIDYIRRTCLSANTRLFLTGGEPLVLAELSEIINELGKLNGIIYLGLFTSGVLTDELGRLKAVSAERARELRQKGLIGCYLSIYSHDEHIHEDITKVHGSFQCTLESVSNLIKAGIETRVHCPVMKVNYRSLTETSLYCAEKGIKEVRFLRLVKHGRAKKNWLQIGLTEDEQKDAIVRTLKDLRALGSDIRVTVAGFPDLFDCRPFNIGRKCQAGIGLFYINWKGDIFPCACKKRDPKFVLGNIFNSPAYPNIRSCFSSCRVKCLQDT